MSHGRTKKVKKFSRKTCFEETFLSSIDTKSSEHDDAVYSSDTGIEFYTAYTAGRGNIAETSLSSFQQQHCSSVSLLQKVFDPSAPIRKEELDTLSALNEKH